MKYYNDNNNNCNNDNNNNCMFSQLIKVGCNFVKTLGERIHLTTMTGDIERHREVSTRNRETRNSQAHASENFLRRIPLLPLEKKL